MLSHDLIQVPPPDRRVLSPIMHSALTGFLKNTQQSIQTKGFAKPERKIQKENAWYLNSHKGKFLTR